MKSIAIHVALLTGLGALLFMGTVATTVPAAAKCMIDEGNGRRTPCDAMYKSTKCYVDEGNGRLKAARRLPGCDNSARASPSPPVRGSLRDIPFYDCPRGRSWA
jgi:hypothetical protein